MKDNNLNRIKELLEKVSENLINNNMSTFIVESKEEVAPLIEKMIKKGSVVATGGSISLKECGVYDFIKNGQYEYLDRNAEGLTAEEIQDIYIKSFSADTYLCSSNAVTEKGDLYNVDGNST